MKKNSAKMKLLSAAGMLGISAAMLATSTYAWFTMNTEVSVTGMKLKATASDGIVISGDNKSTWSNAWDVTMSGSVLLEPTSTDAAVSPAWVSATSQHYDNADKDQTGTTATYKDLSLSYAVPSGITGNVFADDEGVGSADNHNYVLLKNFYIKATGSQDWAQKLIIDEVTAAAANGTSTNLNKSLRVLMVVNGKSFLYAPIEGYDNTSKYKANTALTFLGSAADSDTGITSIPISDDDAINVKMYMFFDGEDKECKSSNLNGITLDDLTVSAKFKTGEIS